MHNFISCIPSRLPPPAPSSPSLSSPTPRRNQPASHSVKQTERAKPTIKKTSLTSPSSSFLRTAGQPASPFVSTSPPEHESSYMRSSLGRHRGEMREMEALSDGDDDVCCVMAGERKGKARKGKERRGLREEPRMFGWLLRLGTKVVGYFFAILGASRYRRWVLKGLRNKTWKYNISASRERAVCCHSCIQEAFVSCYSQTQGVSFAVDTHHTPSARGRRSAVMMILEERRPG
ncbi:hypothetical protein IWX90DRAFT_208932 [Phyllosticta citrichinensis]|uniref:Uncharacterized protein n=1 Tax=Phyllosticta citrichinensis TaxID=1130410 RepID=A0ABR1XSQ8_9PEZI